MGRILLTVRLVSSMTRGRNGIWTMGWRTKRLRFAGTCRLGAEGAKRMIISRTRNMDAWSHKYNISIIVIS